MRPGGTPDCPVPSRQFHFATTARRARLPKQLATGKSPLPADQYVGASARGVAQTFLFAGSRNFPVPCSRTARAFTPGPPPQETGDWKVSVAGPTKLPARRDVACSKIRTTARHGLPTAYGERASVLECSSPLELWHGSDIGVHDTCRAALSRRLVAPKRSGGGSVAAAEALAKGDDTGLPDTRFPACAQSPNPKIPLNLVKCKR